MSCFNSTYLCIGCFIFIGVYAWYFIHYLTRLVLSGIDPWEKVKISMTVARQFGTAEFTKYRVHFPEEGVYLNLTGRLANSLDVAVRDASEKGKSAIDDAGFLHPRPITERLLRRVVAKLLRVSLARLVFLSTLPSQSILTLRHSCQRLVF